MVMDRILIPGSTTKSWKFSELWKATNGFCEDNVVGKGGYGTVYRGDLEGTAVAIKRLAERSNHGQDQFMKEVEIIGAIHHRNLVVLQGYCIEGDEVLLVYDFMANGSLQDWLLKDEKQLPWNDCMRILVETASAIGYLHHGCKEKIIHRDIKPANILLDSNFQAHISDFGLAKSTLVADMHVTTEVMGTLGFLAPEYARTGKLTEKSDVYSFGVLMLSVITNKPPLVEQSEASFLTLVDLAFAALQEDRLLDMVSNHFQGTYNPREAQRVLSVALMCVQDQHHLRPSMEQILHMMCGTEDVPPMRVHKEFVWTITNLSRRWTRSDSYRRMEDDATPEPDTQNLASRVPASI